MDAPELMAAGRELLVSTLAERNRGPAGFPIVLATLWTYVTEDAAEARARLEMLAGMLGRDAETVVEQVLIGGAEKCAALLRRYSEAGVQRAFIWPIGEPQRQLELFMREVAPAV